jgi:hypothetical protein
VKAGGRKIPEVESGKDVVWDVAGVNKADEGGEYELVIDLAGAAVNIFTCC